MVDCHSNAVWQIISHSGACNNDLVFLLAHLKVVGVEQLCPWPGSASQRGLGVWLGQPCSWCLSLSRDQRAHLPCRSMPKTKAQEGKQELTIHPETWSLYSLYFLYCWCSGIWGPSRLEEEAASPGASQFLKTVHNFTGSVPLACKVITTFI